MSGAWNLRGDVRRRGLPYEITHLHTNAQAQAILNQAAADDRDVWFRDGTHSGRSLTIPNGGNGKITGAGQSNTILEPNSNGDDVLSITASAITHSLQMEGFGIVGSKTGTGAGINIPSTSTLFNCRFADLFIQGMGGAGFKDSGISFSQLLQNIRVNDCKDHLFDILGSISYVMMQTYAQEVPTAGKAGYRLRGGYPMLIGANGINSGDYWGLFGQSVALDGVLSYTYPHLIGCNIEDFAVTGIRSRNNGYFLESCTFVAPVSGTVKATEFDAAVNKAGMVLNHLGFLTKGATWANSLPIHGYSTPAPFVLFPGNGNPIADSYQFYDDAFSVTETVSSPDLERVAFGRHAFRLRDLKYSSRLYKGSVSNVFDSSGTGTPEGVVTAAVGSTFFRTDGGAGTTFYVKESGTGNTGWVGK